MMKGSRRNFLFSAISGGVAATLPSLARAAVRKPASIRPEELEARYAKLDEALKKRELFPAPVIIETLELLRYKDSFLCLVRSKDRDQSRIYCES
jgi:phosphoglycolate phosphatase-like HAD superfamily hydrolase